MKHLSIFLMFRLFSLKSNIFFKKFSLPNIIGTFALFLLFSACNDNIIVRDTEECISGIMVGEKCGVIGFKPDKKKALGAQVWEKETIGQQENIRIDNVIGIIGLPAGFKENERIFLKLRKATEEEQLSLDCYLSLPGPPKPMYVVINQNSLNCPN